MANPLQQLHALGQSIWLDYIDRTMLHNGELARRIRDDALTGMTSNPTIFEKALAQGTAYDAQLGGHRRRPHRVGTVRARRDGRRARGVRHLPPVYDAAKGADGFVSIEVSPAVPRTTRQRRSPRRTGSGRLWTART